MYNGASSAMDIDDTDKSEVKHFSSINQQLSSDFYEGCGKEGPICCIFFSEFHPTAGPKITCQYPEDFISKEIFDAVSVYIIPKPQLQRRILTVNALGHKIVGYPVRIDHSKYDRNAFYFNLCFVCEAWARSVQYEPVVKKFAECLVTMERESGFLSCESTKSQLPDILKQVLKDLNQHRIATVTVGSSVIYLKLVRVASDPPPVDDYQVPVFMEDKKTFRMAEWDLTTQQILSFIDGYNHVAKIAALADVENNLVKACVQNLVYYGVVNLIPIFQYSNVYTPMPRLHSLAADPTLAEECINYVSIHSECAEHPKPCLKDVFRMLCNMTYSTTVRDLCLRFNPQSLGVDERKLIQFALLNGLIRRVEKYPMWVGEDDRSFHHRLSPKNIFTGALSFDEICCRTGLSYQRLDDIVESDNHILCLWK